MKFTKKLLKEINISCGECLSKEFKIIKNGTKLKCKICGYKGGFLNTEPNDYESLEKFIKERNVKCGDCFGDEFEIIENGKKAKCKNCGLESETFDTKPN